MEKPNSFEDTCDKLLYSLKSLADMGETISGVRSIEKAAREILHIVLGTMGASKGALLKLDGTRLTVTAARGVSAGTSITASRELLLELENAGANFLLRWEPGFPEELKKLCDTLLPELAVVLAVILRAQNKMVGLFVLSKRFMHQMYSREDLEVLDTICRHVSVALYNFDLRRKIQATNFQLSRKVLQLESLHDIGLSVASFKPRTETLLEVLYGSMSLLDARKSFYLEARSGMLSIGPYVGVNEAQLESFIAHKTYTKKLLSGKSLKLSASRTVKQIFGSGTCLAVPVKTSNKLFGSLAVIGKESKEKHASFSSDDKKLLEAFATQAAVALENEEMQEAMIEQERLKKELETAAAIHRLIVPAPEDLPSVEGYRIYGHNFPCKEVGGDYFDVIPISKNRFGLVICDVSGKGLSAALLVSTLQATFHSLFQSHMTLLEIVDQANKLLIRNTTAEKYASGFFGIIDTSDGTLETVNAGHNEPLLVHGNGEIEKIYTGGFCLGMFESSSYQSQKTELSPGDILYLYTDGISEAFSPDGEEFGTGRLEAFIKSKAGAPPEELLREIERTIREWTGQYTPGESFAHDDFTQLAIQLAD
ncbi:MAG: SpoIIE family protein phosphatase [bacterium]|nr:MAG: SpoIIE family protein phosphatase [bacterium]